MGKLKPLSLLPVDEHLVFRREMQTAKLTIRRGFSDCDIYHLARDSRQEFDAHGAFHWNNRVARNTVRHCLTNYEELWWKLNPGAPGITAYNTLRTRVDKLVDETYPQFAENMPEVEVGEGWEHKRKEQPSPAPPPAPRNTSMATALSAAYSKLKRAEKVNK